MVKGYSTSYFSSLCNQLHLGGNREAVRCTVQHVFLGIAEAKRKKKKRKMSIFCTQAKNNHPKVTSETSQGLHFCLSVERTTQAFWWAWSITCSGPAQLSSLTAWLLASLSNMTSLNKGKSGIYAQPQNCLHLVWRWMSCGGNVFGKESFIKMAEKLGWSSECSTNVPLSTMAHSTTYQRTMAPVEIAYRSGSIETKAIQMPCERAIYKLHC